MTVSTIHTKSIYNGGTSDTSFSVTFQYPRGHVNDLIVEMWDYTDPEYPVNVPFPWGEEWLIDETDYPDTHVVLVNPIPIDFKLIVYRRTSALQGNHFIRGPFPAKAVEYSHDHAIFLIQEILEFMQRAVLSPMGGPSYPADILQQMLDQLQELQDFVDHGGSLPVGGAIGSLITKMSAEDGDADWVQYAFSGFSSRFNAQFDSTDLMDTLAKIIQITYTPPTVSLSASGNSLREKGTPVTSTTLSANVTKRSNDIAKIEFFIGATSLEVLEPPTNTGSGVTTYAWSGSFSDNTTFRVEVTDEAEDGGPSTVSSTTTFNFVYPYYTGAGIPFMSATELVGDLNKEVIANNNSIARTFTADNGDVFYFGFPASYGSLVSILDQNGFETIGSWTQRSMTITGLDGTPQSYFVYEFNNVQVANTATFIFRR